MGAFGGTFGWAVLPDVPHWSLYEALVARCLYMIGDHGSYEYPSIDPMTYKTRMCAG